MKNASPTTRKQRHQQRKPKRNAWQHAVSLCFEGFDRPIENPRAVHHCTRLIKKRASTVINQLGEVTL
jgi:hypothetical protein